MNDEIPEFESEYGGSDLEETNPNEDAADTESYAYQEAEETSAEIEAAEETPPAPANEAEESEYTPPAYNVPLLSVEAEALFTEQEQEQLNDMFLNGQGAQATAIITHRAQQQNLRVMQRMMQANVLHTTTLATAEAECGEWFRQHGGTIRQTMATLPPDQAGTETAKFAALIAPALYEVQAGADAVKTFTRMARMAARTAAQQTIAPQATPQPPPRVAPSGSRTGATLGRKPGVITDMMELFGAEEGDVRRAIDVAKGR